jgi:hypothetical protein
MKHAVIKGIGLAVKVLCLLGVLVVLINLYGYLISLRAPEIRGLLKSDITLSYESAMANKDRRKSETNERYLYRLTLLVNQSMAHIWEDPFIDEYHLRVPVWENFILYLRSFTSPEIYRKYEFVDYAKAVERGVGLCSQQSLVLADILNANGVPADIVALDGHVVVRAEISDGRWYVADPDYGIVMPHDIGVIEENVQLVRHYYRNVDDMYVVSNPAVFYQIGAPTFREYLTGIYGRDGNRIYRGDSQTYVPRSVQDFERFAYVLKWLVPAVMVMPQLIWTAFIFYKRRRGAIYHLNRAVPSRCPERTMSEYAKDDKLDA